MEGNNRERQRRKLLASHSGPYAIIRSALSVALVAYGKAKGLLLNRTELAERTVERAASEDELG